MKLPNAERAVVEREKIVDYLLNPAHRHGASKARFFSSFGFRIEQWERLLGGLSGEGGGAAGGRGGARDGPRSALRSGGRTDGSRRPFTARPFGLANGSRRGCAPIDHRLSSRHVMKIKEHECVVLTADLPGEGLKAGDLGTVVHIHRRSEERRVGKECRSRWSP